MPLVKAVPWSSKNAWFKVYISLLQFEQQQALDYIEAWRSRMRLPVAVECTYMLLPVINKDRQASVTQAELGTALVRSVNFLVDQLQVGVAAQSVESLAARLAIPKWVVDLRHEIVHGITFPQATVLSLACELLFSRILDSYWHPQAQLFDRKSADISDLHAFVKTHADAPTSKLAVHDLKQLALALSDKDAADWLLEIATANASLARDLAVVMVNIFSPEFPVRLVNAIVANPASPHSVEVLTHVIGNFPRLKDFARYRAFSEAHRRCHDFEYAELVMPLLDIQVPGDRKYLFVGLGKDLDWENGEIVSFLAS